MNRWLIARDDREFPHNSRWLLREGKLARVYVNGGAIALGRPVGMSGARLVLTLALELRRRGGGTGAAALCGGGGQGDALILRVR
jgi:acetyl-CoA C-acetyltransferase